MGYFHGIGVRASHAEERVRPSREADVVKSSHTVPIFTGDILSRTHSSNSHGVVISCKVSHENLSLSSKKTVICYQK